MSRTFRNAAATLLIAIAATLAGASPAHANLLPGHRAFEDPARIQPARSFLVSLLIGIFEFAGGAMDPNGKS
jgi:hypothetical protein